MVVSHRLNHLSFLSLAACVPKHAEPAACADYLLAEQPVTRRLLCAKGESAFPVASSECRLLCGNIGLSARRGVVGLADNKLCPKLPAPLLVAPSLRPWWRRVSKRGVLSAPATGP